MANTSEIFNVTSVTLTPGTWMFAFCIQAELTVVPKAIVPSISDSGVNPAGIGFNIPSSPVSGFPRFLGYTSSQIIYTLDASRVITQRIYWENGTTGASFPPNAFTGFYRAVRIA